MISNYLDSQTTFVHPLSDWKAEGEEVWGNAWATVGLILDMGYLDPSSTDDGGAKARAILKTHMGDSLTPALERGLHDRYLPTIYQVCTLFVDRFDRGGFNCG